MNKFTLVLLLVTLFSLSHSTPIYSIDLETLCDLSAIADLNNIYTKVKPTIIYAILKDAESGFKKGDLVEVLQDVANGKHYKVSSPTLCTWVHGYNLEFITPPSSILPPLHPIELESYINSYDNISQTPYFIWVDLARQMTYIFTGSNRHWQTHKLILCATGKLTTSTIRGNFLISERGELLHSKELAKYWVRFFENYLFHSCPIDEFGNVIDNRLGTPISNGCIRMCEEDAKWFFSTIPVKTAVWIY